MTATLCASTFTNTYVLWHKRSVMLRFVAVPARVVRDLFHCSQPQTLIKRLATRHDLFAQLAGRRGQMKWNSEKNFVLGRIEQRRKDKNLLYMHNSKPTKEGPLSYVPLESPFASVPAIGRGNFSLVFLFSPRPPLILIWTFKDYFLFFRGSFSFEKEYSVIFSMALGEFFM